MKQFFENIHNINSQDTFKQSGIQLTNIQMILESFKDEHLCSFPEATRLVSSYLQQANSIQQLAISKFKPSLINSLKAHWLDTVLILRRLHVILSEDLQNKLMTLIVKQFESSITDKESISQKLVTVSFAELSAMDINSDVICIYLTPNNTKINDAIKTIVSKLQPYFSDKPSETQQLFAKITPALLEVNPYQSQQHTAFLTRVLDLVHFILPEDQHFIFSTQKEEFTKLAFYQVIPKVMQQKIDWAQMGCYIIAVNDKYSVDQTILYHNTLLLTRQNELFRSQNNIDLKRLETKQLLKFELAISKCADELSSDDINKISASLVLDTDTHSTSTVDGRIFCLMEILRKKHTENEIVKLLEVILRTELDDHQLQTLLVKVYDYCPITQVRQLLKPHLVPIIQQSCPSSATPLFLHYIGCTSNEFPQQKTEEKSSQAKPDTKRLQGVLLELYKIIHNSSYWSLTAQGKRKNNCLQIMLPIINSNNNDNTVNNVIETLDTLNLFYSNDANKLLYTKALINLIIELVKNVSDSQQTIKVLDKLYLFYKSDGNKHLYLDALINRITELVKNTEDSQQAIELLGTLCRFYEKFDKKDLYSQKLINLTTELVKNADDSHQARIHSKLLSISPRDNSNNKFYKHLLNQLTQYIQKISNDETSYYILHGLIGIEPCEFYDSSQDHQQQKESYDFNALTTELQTLQKNFQEKTQSKVSSCTSESSQNSLSKLPSTISPQIILEQWVKHHIVIGYHSSLLNQMMPMTNNSNYRNLVVHSNKWSLNNPIIKLIPISNQDIQQLEALLIQVATSIFSKPYREENITNFFLPILKSQSTIREELLTQIESLKKQFPHFVWLTQTIFHQHDNDQKQIKDLCNALQGQYGSGLDLSLLLQQMAYYQSHISQAIEHNNDIFSSPQKKDSGHSFLINSIGSRRIVTPTKANTQVKKSRSRRISSPYRREKTKTSFPKELLSRKSLFQGPADNENQTSINEVPIQVYSSSRELVLCDQPTSEPTYRVIYPSLFEFMSESQLSHFKSRNTETNCDKISKEQIQMLQQMSSLFIEDMKKPKPTLKQTPKPTPKLTNEDITKLGRLLQLADVEKEFDSTTNQPVNINIHFSTPAFAQEFANMIPYLNSLFGKEIKSQEINTDNDAVSIGSGLYSLINPIYHQIKALQLFQRASLKNSANSSTQLSFPTKKDVKNFLYHFSNLSNTSFQLSDTKYHLDDDNSILIPVRDHLFIEQLKTKFPDVKCSVISSTNQSDAHLSSRFGLFLGVAVVGVLIAAATYTVSKSNSKFGCVK